jgi:hypothetical protein
MTIEYVRAFRTLSSERFFRVGSRFAQAVRGMPAHP